MKYPLATLTLVLLSLPTQAEELVKSVSLTEVPLTITAVPGKHTHLLIELPDPGVSSPVYALKGMVHYEDVQGDAFLQLENHFGSKGAFITKGIAATGPLGKIIGSSDWRPFLLPFYANSGDEADSKLLLPEKLTLSLYLPGSGTVSVADVGLYQYANGEDPLQTYVQAGYWFSNQTAGWIGGIGGTLLGLWGALIGIVSSRGKARGFAVGSANALLFIGLASIIAGIVALSMAQPYAVYYPLLLLGVIIVAVMFMLRRTMLARYEQLELKRMQSMDA
jgi:hypothetical protein